MEDHKLLTLYTLLFNIDGKFYDNKLYHKGQALRTLTEEEHREKLKPLIAEAKSWMVGKEELIQDISKEYDITKLYLEKWGKNK